MLLFFAASALALATSIPSLSIAVSVQPRQSSCTDGCVISIATGLGCMIEETNIDYEVGAWHFFFSRDALGI